MELEEAASSYVHTSTAPPTTAPALTTLSASYSSTTQDRLRESLERQSDCWRIVPEQTTQKELARLMELLSFRIGAAKEDDDEEEEEKNEQQEVREGDRNRNQLLDDITETVRESFGASWACVSLVDMTRQRFASFAEAPNKPFAIPNGTARKDSFCQHVILQGGVMVVKDAAKDDRFRTSKHVQGEPGFRFYAAVPLVSEGHNIGTLCVLDPDQRPHGINPKQEEQLKSKAKEVVQILADRREQLQTLRKRSSSNDLTKETVPGPKALQPVAGSSNRGDECSTDGGMTATKAETEAASPAKDADENSTKGKRSRASSPSPEHNVRCSRPAALQPIIPTPQDANMDPDEYLACLVEALWPGVKLKVKPATQLEQYFPAITEEQMARYNNEVVNMARCNDVEGLRRLLQEEGRDALDCFNRFGEGLLNMACR
jgi:GAF domain